VGENGSKAGRAGPGKEKKKGGSAVPKFRGGEKKVAIYLLWRRKKGRAVVLAKVVGGGVIEKRKLPLEKEKRDRILGFPDAKRQKKTIFIGKKKKKKGVASWQIEKARPCWGGTSPL